MSNEKIKKLRAKLLKLSKNARGAAFTSKTEIMAVIYQQKAMMYFEISEALGETILDD